LAPIQTEQLEKPQMQKFLIAAAAACLIATPVAAGELRAQSTELSSQGIHIEGPGVGVRVGPERRRHERRDGFRDREVRGEGCKTVTVRETLPDGTRVKRTRSTC
jgi:hypothetical protein